MKKRERMKQLGLTMKDWNELFEKQGGRCATCGIHQSELIKSLGVDHCHETMKVRGLLCTPCNSALGFVRDNPTVLQRMIVYLKENGKVLKEMF
jgi:hypothetical protein